VLGGGDQANPVYRLTRPGLSNCSTGAQSMSGLIGRSSILIGSLLRGEIVSKHGVDLQVVAGRLFLIHLPQRP